MGYLELSIRATIHRYYDDLADFEQQINMISTALTQYKQRSNLFDYDVLMHVLRYSLRDYPSFKQALQNTINYILVDEYQYTNNVQREIVELLADKDKKVTVVGDDSQSIYAFRGANFENILRFPSKYPDCGVVKLEQNYRSQTGILNFTNDVIDDAGSVLRSFCIHPKKKIENLFSGSSAMPIMKRSILSIAFLS